MRVKTQNRVVRCNARMNIRNIKEGFMDLIKAFTNEQLKSEVPQFNIGDTVRVHNKIVEGTRERIQMYEGTVIAKHDGGDFMLRIEDTDQERFVEGATEIIYRTMEKTGLIHDEGPDKDGGYGPYVQSERMRTGIYMKYAKELIEKGEAYYCFCDKERLASLKTEVVDGKEIMIYDKHCLHLSKE